jgi:aspartate/methionine/tyrosine aminotransferase
LKLCYFIPFPSILPSPMSSVLATLPDAPLPSLDTPSIARAVVSALRSSKIRDVANVGMALPGVLPFWFGESNQVTPAFIRDAASRALADGYTFYSHNLGMAPLREALATYGTGLHGGIDPANIGVTAGGVSALMLATQILVGTGDRVVAVTPLWPNLVEMPKIVGAQVETVSLTFGPEGWQLDLDRLLDALTPGTRMVMVNSPNNPTGWVMPRQQQVALLAHCRKLGIWIVADEVYERLYYGDQAASPGGDTAIATAALTDSAPLIAPSFLDISTRNERVIVVNSFSKSWLMTGWRLGWAIAPQALMDDWGKLAEYNTSCVADFVQRAGVVAVQQGEIVARTVQRDLHARRDHLFAALSNIPGVDVKLPAGAMYLFFRIAGFSDSLALCKDLVRTAKLGLAPGIAFGEEGEGYVRWCYASETAQLDLGVQRLGDFLTSQGTRI